MNDTSTGLLHASGHRTHVFGTAAVLWIVPTVAWVALDATGHASQDQWWLVGTLLLAILVPTVVAVRTGSVGALVASLVGVVLAGLLLWVTVVALIGG